MSTTLNGGEIKEAVTSRNIDRACETLKAGINTHAKNSLQMKKQGGPYVKQPTDTFTRALTYLHKWHHSGFCSKLNVDVTNCLLRAGTPAETVEPYTSELAEDAKPEEIDDRRKMRQRFKKTLFTARAAMNANETEQRIRTALENRDIMYATNPKYIINKALSRARNTGTIDHVMTPGWQADEHQVTREPETVKREIARQVGKWFASEGPIDPNSIPPHWRTAFNPVTHLNGSEWGDLLQATTEQELTETFAKCAKDKAPGETGHPLKVYEQIHKATPKELLSLVNLILERGEFPTDWSKAIVYLIPKTTNGYTGWAEGTRPISLLETMSKLIMKIIIERMTKVMIKYEVLRCAKFSGLPGTSTTVPITVLHAAVAQAKYEQQPLWVYFEDKSKAFDTVPHSLLELAFRRIRLPEKFIRFYMDKILKGRSAKVITAYGLSDPIEVLRGIPQGGVESPLVWNIYYDAGLCHIDKEFRSGTIATPTPITGITIKAYAGRHRNVDGSAAPPIRDLGTTTISNIAFIDDVAFYAKTKTELQHMIDRTAEFNAISRIRNNPLKGAVLAINAAQNEKEAPLTSANLEGDRKEIPWVGDEFRYLGVYIDREFNGRASTRALDRELTEQLRSIKKCRLSAHTKTYIINSCTIATALYRSKINIPSQAKLDKWEKTIRDTVRQALGGSKSLHWPYLHARMSMGLHSMKEKMVQSHTLDICTMMNGPSKDVGTIAIKCLVGLVQAT
jgi:hypothetical protein